MTLAGWLWLSAVLFLIRSVLATLAKMTYSLAGRVEALWKRCDEIDDVEFSGQIAWPIDPDDSILDGLREEAGDEDDHKRAQLESVIRLTETRH